ncbi:MAG: C45 family autoproteolytic acyltransferase/hydrolase, partial [Solirubrobacteraceae bacterium]
MTAELQEATRDGFLWTTVCGQRGEVFEALGEHARADVAHVLAALPQLQDLRARRESEPALRDHLTAVAVASQRDCPQTWSELEALAAGASVETEELLLLNLRGDLGPVAGPAAAATGCTSIAWSDGRHALLGHNEDGAPELSGRCRLLTLRIADLPSVTIWWYPGFIPSNTFAVNSAGIACAIDHLNVIDPAVAPGRHFVARDVHRCVDLDDAVGLLGRRPSAGGFAYTLGQAGRTGIHT